MKIINKPKRIIYDEDSITRSVIIEFKSVGASGRIGLTEETFDEFIKDQYPGAYQSFLERYDNDLGGWVQEEKSFNTREFIRLNGDDEMLAKYFLNWIERNRLKI